MTILDAPPKLDLVEPPPVHEPEPVVELEPDHRPPLADLIRPAAASALVAVAAGFEVGGIFGSWPARLLAALAAAAGAGFAVLAQRSHRRDTLLLLFPVALVAVATASLLTAPGGPADVVPLVRAALRSGSLLQPPVPFDPGWRVVLIVTLGLLGFAGAWIATALNRSRLGLAIGLPVIGLTAITQPDDAKVIAGAVPIVFIIAALALLFGGDARSARELGRAFELKRAARAAAIGVPLVIGVVLLSKASFLFPKPVYDPVSSAQKPRLVSAASDDVLFEVRTKAKFTGPWRVGVLDTYKDDTFLLPPQDNKRLAEVSGEEPLPEVPLRSPTSDVTLVLHNLGDTPILPSLAGTVSVKTTLKDLYVDRRTDLLRITSGRLPAGLEYTLRVPPYASTVDLRDANPATGEDVVSQLVAPPPPPAVVELLSKAPTTNRFDRMEYVIHALLDHVTAKGAGVPVPVSPDRVQDLLAGSKIGSPYEIVAAQALIARWAGIPSRIGFGYDGVNKEQTGVVSVRPRNAADWLEVNYQGFGWLPLISQPKQAQQDLNNKPKQKHILANDEIAVQVFVPYKVVTAKQLYQIVRYWLLVSSPFVLLLLGMYLGWPAVARARRRAKRRRWAAALTPAHQIAVEYAEMRDTATDLNVGDLISTPLEYLFQVAHDDEHAELAWLTTRALYGDLMETATAADVTRAEEMSRSVRRRLVRAQPVQSQFLAAVSRASLRTPYEPAMPNVRVLRLPRPFAAMRRGIRRGLRATTIALASIPRPRRRMSV
jgi:transglutaminase-like putative cysteine protease